MDSKLTWKALLNSAWYVRAIIFAGLLVIFVFGACIAAQVKTKMKAVITDDNAEIACLEFQRIIVEGPPNLPNDELKTALVLRIISRMGHIQDGWGQDMNIDVKWADPYYSVIVRSKGPDGIFNTNDDIVVEQTISKQGQVITTKVNGK